MGGLRETRRDIESLSTYHRARCGYREAATLKYPYPERLIHSDYAAFYAAQIVLTLIALLNSWPKKLWLKMNEFHGHLKNPLKNEFNMPEWWHSEERNMFLSHLLKNNDLANP